MDDWMQKLLMIGLTIVCLMFLIMLGLAIANLILEMWKALG